MARECRECGSPLPPRKSKTGRAREFCSASCRQSFINRRLLRGAELYDHYMASRYQRTEYPSHLSVVNNMCRIWREEDKRERDGRVSWNDISKSDR